MQKNMVKIIKLILMMRRTIKLRVLSLFDGISCARVALERVGFRLERYCASEIDTYAIKVAQKNYPDTVQVGDITQLQGKDFENLDLIIGGSPCQDLSGARHLSLTNRVRKGLAGKRSGLFWDYVRLLQEIKPKYFVLENVNSMSKEAKKNYFRYSRSILHYD